MIDVAVTPVASAPTQSEQNLRYPLDEQGNIPFMFIKNDFVENFKQLGKQRNLGVKMENFNPAQSRIQLRVGNPYQYTQVNIFKYENQMVIQYNCDRAARHKAHYCQSQWEALQFLNNQLGESCLKPDYLTIKSTNYLSPTV